GVDPMPGEELEAFADRGRLQVMDEGENCPASWAHLARQLLQHGGMEFAERWDEEAYDMGRVGLHRHGVGVAVKAQLMNGAFDPVAIQCAHRHPVEVPRYRADGDACRRSYIDDRGG